MPPLKPYPNWTWLVLGLEQMRSWRWVDESPADMISGRKVTLKIILEKFDPEGV